MSTAARKNMPSMMNTGTCNIQMRASRSAGRAPQIPSLPTRICSHASNVWWPTLQHGSPIPTSTTPHAFSRSLLENALSDNKAIFSTPEWLRVKPREIVFWLKQREWKEFQASYSEADFPPGALPRFKQPNFGIMATVTQILASSRTFANGQLPHSLRPPAPPVQPAPVPYLTPGPQLHQQRPGAQGGGGGRDQTL